MQFEDRKTLTKKKTDSEHHEHHDDIPLELSKKFRFEPPLYIQRYDYLINLIIKFDCKSVLDIGCAECKLINNLKNFNQNLNLIIGIDIDESLLINSSDKFQNNVFDFVQPREKPLDLYLIKGDISNSNEYFLDKLSYDKSGLDIVSLIEVIEHMNESTLDGCMQTVFDKLKPRLVLITTPNCEYNQVFDDHMPINDNNNEMSINKPKFRHWDHKFEWTRYEFQTWCQNKILNKFKNYKLYQSYDGVGIAPQGYEQVGYCSQIAVFINESYDNVLKKETNQFQNYLNEKIRIYLHNRNLNLNHEKKIIQKPYLDPDCFLFSNIKDNSNYKLVYNLSYPFEIYEFDNVNERNKALLDEINYLIMFLTRPSKISHDKTEEEILDRIENNIDIYDERIRLAKMDKLIDFNSIKKFKFEKNNLINLMKQNGYKFTLNHKYVIYVMEEKEESESDLENYNSEIIKENDYSKQDNDYMSDENNNLSIENKRHDQIDSYKPFKHSFNDLTISDEEKIEPLIELDKQNDLQLIFQEEMWDQYIKPTVPFLKNECTKTNNDLLREQFEDVESNHLKDVDIEKILNYTYKYRGDRLKLHNFKGHNYYADEQKNTTNKLRAAIKKTILNLRNDIIVDNDEHILCLTKEQMRQFSSD